MIGHEIGHALFTPDIDAGKQTQGPWTSAAEEIGGNVHASYVQGIMQIVEDVRIERKVKEKYPGRRRDFSAGYRTLRFGRLVGTRMHCPPVEDLEERYVNALSGRDLRYSVTSSELRLRHSDGTELVFKRVR
jgi:hypothetical protein